MTNKTGILIVYDDPDFRNPIRDFLKPVRYQVTAVAKGKTGLKKQGIKPLG